MSDNEEPIVSDVVEDVEPEVTEVVEDVEPEESPEESAPEETPEESAPEETPEESAPEVTPEESEPEEVTPEEPVTEVVEDVEPTEVATEEVSEEVSQVSVDVTPVEQVASDIRRILTDVPTPDESVEPVVSDQLCSLKTLVNVLGKWSSHEIRRRHVEDLLKEDSEVDENLDNLEKVVEILQLWITEGGSTFREHNHFKNLDEYTLVGESRNLSEEKKVEVLKKVTDLVVNVLHRRVSDSERDNIINNLY